MLLFNLFRRLPDDMIVSQRLPALHGAGPDFCLVQAERALLLAVSAATPQDVQRMQQMDLFGTAVEPVGVAEESRLSAFMAGR